MFPDKTIIEMKRRAAFLREEVQAWKEAAHANQDSWGSTPANSPRWRT